MSIEFYIAKLKQYPRDQKVKRGFGELYSWRGSYDEAAVGIVEETTVGEMLDYAETAIGTTMYGYKGGEYPIGSHTTLNVEEKGRYTDGGYVMGLLLDLMLNDTADDLQAEIERLKTLCKEAADYLDGDTVICAGSSFHEAFVDAGASDEVES